MILSKKTKKTKALIILRGCGFVVRKTPEDRFCGTLKLLEGH